MSETITVEEMPKPTINEFLDSCKSEATKRIYDFSLSRILGKDKDNFLNMSTTQQENILVDFIKIAKKSGNSGVYINGNLTAVRSLMNYYDMKPIAWKRKIMRLLPDVVRVSGDRAPSKEEIQKLLEVCDVRTRSIILILVSSGIRIGALVDLKMKDYEPVDLADSRRIGKLKVYSGTSDQYITFISDEATASLEKYLEIRTRTDEGEKLTPNSPLFRAVFGDTNVRKNRHKVKPLKVSALSFLMAKKWVKAGVRGVAIGKMRTGVRHDFKLNHGFRKYFRTSLADAGMDNLKIELFMGHKVGLEATYSRFTEKQLIEAYAKFMRALHVTETSEVKEQLKEERTVNQISMQELRKEFEAFKTSLQMANLQQQLKLKEKE